MDWVAWIVLAALAMACVVWFVRRWRTESRRLDGILRDFNREHPRREPGFATRARRLVGARRRR